MQVDVNNVYLLTYRTMVQSLGSELTETRTLHVFLLFD